MILRIGLDSLPPISILVSQPCFCGRQVRERRWKEPRRTSKGTCKSVARWCCEIPPELSPNSIEHWGGEVVLAHYVNREIEFNDRWWIYTAPVFWLCVQISWDTWMYTREREEERVSSEYLNTWPSLREHRA